MIKDLVYARRRTEKQSERVTTKNKDLADK